MRLNELGEIGLIARIKNVVGAPTGSVHLGIDDDAAVLKTAANRLLLLATDAFVEGVHFDLGYMTFEQLGWRTLAANLSDIAAMAGRPITAVVCLAVPEPTEVAAIEDFYRGMTSLARQYQTAIVGGDTVRSPDRIFVSVAVTGEVAAEKVTRRSGALAGDGLFVTGELGGSRAGLDILRSKDQKMASRFSKSAEKHLTPQPRVEEARFLVQNFPIHAMIDISDGLLSEARHICRQSGVGATIFSDSIPITAETQEIARRFRHDALDYAFSGGEDFELLFAAPHDMADPLCEAFQEQFGYGCALVGKIAPGDRIEVRDADGRPVSVVANGYEHFQR